MSKQTALTKAIEQINKLIEKSNYALYDSGCEHAIYILTDLLPYEREVIEEAYKKGEFNFGASIFDDGSDCINSTDYFTKTFTENGK